MFKVGDKVKFNTEKCSKHINDYWYSITSRSQESYVVDDVYQTPFGLAMSLAGVPGVWVSEWFLKDDK